ncbi:MAG: DUF2911 domain-containing protein [Acidobacteriota bacterium]
MRKMKMMSCFLALWALVGSPLYAQEGSLRAVGGGRVAQRAAARILYMNPADNSFPGQLVVHYGQPVWKAEYEDLGLFDKMTRGQVWRLGNNFWTVLDTNLPLRVSGRDIGVGSYYLGVHRSQDGDTWSLAFMNPDTIREARLDASEIAKATVDFTVPMSHSKTTDNVENLMITLEHPKDNPADVTLKVTWGNLKLTAPIEVKGLP